MGAQHQIAVVQGAPSAVVQKLLGSFVAELPKSVRVAGVIENLLDTAGEACSVGQLRSIGDGRTFSIAQDLGGASSACKVDAGGIVAACEAVCRAIDAGCDLVVLSKWGKVEADRSGLAAAFAAAVDAGVPILTSVAPRFTSAWEQFAAPMFVILPPQLSSLADWWRDQAAHGIATATAATNAAREAGPTL
ncbi:MAG: DUF2478 domain-containing protein [Caulobacterales bacterium]